MKVVSHKIVLQDYAVNAFIGLHDFEKAARQRVLVSVELYLSYPVGNSDAVANVIDYDFLREEIKKIVDSGHINLQETLCYEIIKLCEGRKGISRVVVSTRKPDVYDDCASVGCTLEATF